MTHYIRRTITPAEVERQRATKAEEIGVGIWKDVHGHVHFSLPDLLDHYELEHTDENIAAVEQILNDFIAELNANAIVLRQDVGPLS